MRRLQYLSHTPNRFRKLKIRNEVYKYNGKHDKNRFSLFLKVDTQKPMNINNILYKLLLF